MQLRVLLTLHFHTGGLGFEIRRVVALIRIGTPAIEFEDPFGNVVQEVPIVGDRDNGSRITLEVLLEPVHALGVKVVGRLIQQK